MSSAKHIKTTTAATTAMAEDISQARQNNHNGDDSNGKCHQPSTSKTATIEIQESQAHQNIKTATI
jgi:hypothetical protein